MGHKTIGELAFELFARSEMDAYLKGEGYAEGVNELSDKEYEDTVDNLREDDMFWGAMRYSFEASLKTALKG